jgi:putative MATE family efflux protein
MARARRGTLPRGADISGRVFMEGRELYLNTSPIRLFAKAALPGAISMLASTLYSLFDGMFVGRILGDTSFAAVNLAIPLVIINFALADLIGVGSSVPISISLGRGDERSANNYFTCACIMIVLTGIFMGAALYAGAMPIMALMGASGELQIQAAQYLQVYALCSPVTTIVFATDNYLRICGRIKGSMGLNIFMSMLTVVLEYLCLGVLGMGVWGAALANCTAMILCALIALYPFVRGKLQLRFCRPRFSMGMLCQVVTSGSPTFLSNVAGRLISIIMNMALIFLGGQSAVTIYGVMMYSGDIVQPLLYGVCDSLQPALGYNYGAGRPDRVKRLEKCILVAGAAISAVAVALMLGIPEQLASLFLQPDEGELIAQSAHAIRLFSLTFLTRWFGFAMQSLLVALDRPLPATALSVGSAFGFPLLVMGMLWPLGLDGLWLNGAVTAALVAVLAAVIMVRLRGRLFAHAGSAAQPDDTHGGND